MSSLHQKEEYRKKRTGLIYDPLMLDYHCLWDPIYPEKPDRIKKPFERCQFYGLVEQCVNIPGRLSTDEEVLKCHTERVNKLMKEMPNMNYDQLMQVSTQYDSMYFHQNCDKAARFALGSSIQLLENLMDDKIDNGFAIIRPPGHHAMHDEPNGYCYFNNAAVVAKTAIEKYNLKRIMIIDWDVHHGQGVQYQFYDDPRVLYFSLHRYDYGNFWPNLRQSDFDYIGEKDGKGFNINIPLNKTGFGNSEYFASFFNVLLPIAYEYNPELIIISCGYDSAIGCFEFQPQLLIVSCGFDSCVGDVKGRMNVTPAGYAHLLNALSCFTNGKLCVLLEGGYCIKSLSEGVALSVRALLGYPCPRVEDFKKPESEFVATLNNLISVLRPYWKCLQSFNDIDDSITLEQYLMDWDLKYRKDIKFYSDETKPEQFELTDFYPLYSEEENMQWDKKIDELIESTDLFVPEKRTCFQIEDKIEFSCNFLTRIENSEYSAIFSVGQQLVQRNFTNGLALVKNLNNISNLIETSMLLAEKYKSVKKIMNVILSDLDVSELKNSENILNIVIGSKHNTIHQQNNSSNLFLIFEDLDDATLITIFLRIILPIAYQFNPDLVLTYTSDFEAIQNSKVTSLGISHIFKYLSALAEGNLVLAFKDTKSILYKKVIEMAVSVLDGHGLSISNPLIPNPNQRNRIKLMIDQLKSIWSCFQFNEKLPK